MSSLLQAPKLPHAGSQRSPRGGKHRTHSSERPASAPQSTLLGGEEWGGLKCVAQLAGSGVVGIVEEVLEGLPAGSSRLKRTAM